MIKRAVNSILARRGYAVQRRVPRDLDPAFYAVYQRCEPYTLTTLERMRGVYDAVRHVVAEDIPGDVVECGVWRGGSAMLAALTLLECGDAERRVHLFDTFAGMSEPSPEDGPEIRAQWDERARDGHNEWCYSPIDDVRANVAATGFSEARTVFVKGKVEDTLPGAAPSAISVLRLDTDWYESTYHELVHLYPRLSPGGVLIIDDYGHWEGARRAVDQYFAELGQRPLLTRLDYTGRMAVKERLPR